MLRSEAPGVPSCRRLLRLLLLPPLLLLLIELPLLLLRRSSCRLLGGGRSGGLGAVGRGAAATSHSKQAPEPGPPSLWLLCRGLPSLRLHTLLLPRRCRLGCWRLRGSLHSLPATLLLHAAGRLACCVCTGSCGCRGRSEQRFSLPRRYQETKQVGRKAVLPHTQRSLHELQRRLLRQRSALDAFHNHQAARRALRGRVGIDLGSA